MDFEEKERHQSPPCLTGLHHRVSGERESK